MSSGEIGVDTVGEVEQPVQASDVSKLASGASISFIGKMTGMGFQVISQVVLARLLGPTLFGLYTIGWTILKIIEMISPLGLQNGVIRYGSRFWRSEWGALRSIIGSSLSTALIASTSLGAVLFIAAPQIEHVLQEPGLTTVIRWFSVAIPLLAGLRVAAAATRVSLKMRFSIYAEELVQPGLNLLLVLVFILLGLRLVGALAAVTISMGIAFLVALRFIIQIYPRIQRIPSQPAVSNRELLLYSLPTAFTSLFTMLINRIDRLFISFYQPAADVGIYQAMAQSTIFFTVILSAFNTIFTPMIADYYNHNRLDRLEELFRISTKWGLYISLPVFLVIVFIPRDLITVIFGSEYASNIYPLLILTLGQLVNVGTGAVGFLLVMTGRQNQWFAISTIMLVLDILLCWILIPTYGIAGAALSSTAAFGGLFFVGLMRVRFSIHLWPYDRRYIKGLGAALITALGLLMIRSVSLDSPAINLALNATTSALIFGATLILFGLDPEDREFLQLLKVQISKIAG